MCSREVPDWLWSDFVPSHKITGCQPAWRVTAHGPCVHCGPVDCETKHTAAPRQGLWMGGFVQLWVKQAVPCIPFPVAIRAYVWTRIDYPLWADKLEKAAPLGRHNP